MDIRRLNSFFTKVASSKDKYKTLQEIGVKSGYIPQQMAENVKKKRFLNYYWANYFQNTPNIKCIPYAKEMPEFCHFQNVQEQPINSIKMYIPLDIRFIKKGVIKIFNFLAQNNIHHSSKVANNHLRNDCIIIRVYNIEDAKKLENFIKNNNYLKQSKIKPNPFLFSSGNIGYIWDGYYSYNYFLANLIEKYTQDKNNPLDINYFKNWIKTIYIKAFIEGHIKTLKEIYTLGHSHFLNKQKENDTVKRLLNIKRLFELLALKLDEEKTVEDFFHYYLNITNKNNEELENMKIYYTNISKQAEENQNIYHYLQGKILATGLFSLAINKNYHHIKEVLNRNNIYENQMDNSEYQELINDPNIKKHVETLAHQDIQLQKKNIEKGIKEETTQNNLSPYLLAGMITKLIELSEKENLRELIITTRLKNIIKDKLINYESNLYQTIDRLKPHQLNKNTIINNLYSLDTLKRKIDFNNLENSLIEFDEKIKIKQKKR